MATKALRTKLYDFHLRQGAKMVDFAGWSMPIHYQNLSLLQSHNWTRQKASIFDVSHMLQTTFKGKDSTKFLETLVVGDLAELKKGQSTLSLFTNLSGGIIDDTVINKRSENSFYVFSNAGCAEKDLDHIRSQLDLFKGDCELKVEDLSLIAIQGPKAVKVIEKFTNLDLSKFAFMSAQKMNIASIPVYISRCGYTGEDGFEISVAYDKV
jgi:aminomethyltransferase